MENKEEYEDGRPNPGHHNDRKNSSENVEDKSNQLASMGISTAYANDHNVDKLTKTLDQYKGKMSEMKEVLRKEERVGRESKRKHEATI